MNPAPRVLLPYREHARTSYPVSAALRFAIALVVGWQRRRWCRLLAAEKGVFRRGDQGLYLTVATGPGTAWGCGCTTSGSRAPNSRRGSGPPAEGASSARELRQVGDAVHQRVQRLQQREAVLTQRGIVGVDHHLVEEGVDGRAQRRALH